MDIQEIIKDLEESLISVQHKIEYLKTLQLGQTYDADMMLTRKEAAYYLGRSTRQIDRLCEENKLVKVVTNSGVRIPKSSVRAFMGLIVTPKAKERQSEHATEFMKIYQKYYR